MELRLSVEQAVLTDQIGPVLKVTINRPEVSNAVNSAVAAGIGRALDRAAHDSAVHVVVLTGTGFRAFCAGADLKALARGESLWLDDPREAAWGSAGYVNHWISKPTIAAVNGAAMGLGTELVLASDLAVAADTAVLGLPEVGRGLLAGAGGAFRLPAQLPRKVALELLLTGEPLTASRALELGLVNRVVPAEKVVAEAMELAARIAAHPSSSVQATKRAAYGVVGGASQGRFPGEELQWQVTEAEKKAVRAGKDAQAGISAFSAKGSRAAPRDEQSE